MPTQFLAVGPSAPTVNAPGSSPTPAPKFGNTNAPEPPGTRAAADDAIADSVIAADTVAVATKARATVSLLEAKVAYAYASSMKAANNNAIAEQATETAERGYRTKTRNLAVHAEKSIKTALSLALTAHY